MESLFQQDLTSAQSRGMGMDISKWAIQRFSMPLTEFSKSLEVLKKCKFRSNFQRRCLCRNVDLPCTVHKI